MSSKKLLMWPWVYWIWLFPWRSDLKTMEISNSRMEGKDFVSLVTLVKALNSAVE